MSFFNFLAPQSSQTDNEFIADAINQMCRGSNVERCIESIETSLTESNMTSVNEDGIRYLISYIGINAKNPQKRDSLCRTISIFKKLITSSNTLLNNANAGVILNEPNSISNITQCLKNPNPNVRYDSLSFIQNLLHIQPKDLQKVLENDGNIVNELVECINDSSAPIVRQIITMIPEIVSGNQIIQQFAAFSVMSPLVDQLNKDNNDVLSCLYALLLNHSANQKLFIETGHLYCLSGPLSNGHQQALNILTILFTSQEAQSYRNHVFSYDFIARE